jgi:hypothetical protein
MGIFGLFRSAVVLFAVQSIYVRVMEKTMTINVRRVISVVAALLCTSVSWAQGKPAASLRIGDPAPSLATAQWLKGTPIKQFERGRVYLLDFWATW